MKKNKEQARERFIKCANSRVRKTLDDIEKIGRLSNGNGIYHSYTEDDVNKIEQALNEAVIDAINSLRLGRKSFSLV